MGCADKSVNSGIQMRGSSVNFQKIESAMQAVGHASRADPPKYLLPEDHSLGAHVVIDDHGAVQKALTDKTALASRQALRSKDYSPLWEGVINLPEPSKKVTVERQIQIVNDWCAQYEMLTGHKVLRADLHLDEGFVDGSGVPRFNAHAHAMCDRTDERGRVIKLSPAQLRAVQTMTAEVTSLERGKDARFTGREHVNHHQYKFVAERNRAENEALKATVEITRMFSERSTEEAQKVPELEEKISSQASQIEELKQQYAADRAALKASGAASQKQYSELKKAHEMALAEVKNLKKKVEQMEAENKKLHAENVKLEADKAKFSAMAADYQAHKNEGLEPALFVPGQNFDQERQRRIDALPELLAKSAGTAHTLARRAISTISANGGADNVHWGRFDEAVAREAIQDRRQAPEAVLNALVTHSPGQADPSMAQRLKKFISELVEDLKQAVRPTSSRTPRI